MNKSKSSLRELTADEVKAVSGGLVITSNFGKTVVGGINVTGTSTGNIGIGGASIGGSGSITFGL